MNHNIKPVQSEFEKDFFNLDDVDQMIITSTMNTLLSADKYKVKKRITKKTGNIIFVNFKKHSK